MIFRPELAKLIRQGRKTMDRRPVKPGEEHCSYHENRPYSIQPGAGKPGLGQLTVTEVRREPLGQITLREAKREGFRNPQEFADHWTELYGSYDPTLEVWVIGFMLGDHSAKERYLAAAPSMQHCTTVTAWRTLPNGRQKAERRCGHTFMDGETSCPLCGSKRPAESMDDHGYTTLAHKGLKGEKAAIPPELQERYSKEGRERHDARKKRNQARRRRLSPAERLHQVEREAARRGVDISSETRLIEQRTSRAERTVANTPVPSDG